MPQTSSSPHVRRTFWVKQSEKKPAPSEDSPTPRSCRVVSVSRREHTSRRKVVPSKPKIRASKYLSNRNFGTGGVDHLVEYLPSLYEALGLVLKTCKTWGGDVPL